MIGLSLGVICLAAVFITVGIIIYRTVYKGKMRTQYKGKWEFLNDTDMTSREGRSLIKNMKKVRSSFVEGEGQDITAKFDTLSDSEDSADLAYGKEEVSEDSELEEAKQLMVLLSLPPPVVGQQNGKLGGYYD